jgi:hypothetical protein
MKNTPRAPWPAAQSSEDGRTSVTSAPPGRSTPTGPRSCRHRGGAWISTFCPARSAPCSNSACHAVSAERGVAAAWTWSTVRGFGARSAAGTATYSAAACCDRQARPDAPCELGGRNTNGVHLDEGVARAAQTRGAPVSRPSTIALPSTERSGAQTFTAGTGQSLASAPFESGMKSGCTTANSRTSARRRVTCARSSDSARSGGLAARPDTLIDLS